MKKTAGIVLDNYKIKTFSKALDEGGFKYKLIKRPSPSVIKVDFTDETFEELSKIVKLSNINTERAN